MSTPLNHKHSYPALPFIFADAFSLKYQKPDEKDLKVTVGAEGAEWQASVLFHKGMKKDVNEREIKQMNGKKCTQ